jgi:hypothetical protein
MSLNLNSESTVTGSDGKTYKVTQTVTEVVTATEPSEPVVTEPPPATDPAPITTQPVSSPPLVYTDARFNANTVSSAITLQRGSSAENKSITDTGHTASIIMLGNNSVKNCRIKSREGLRVAGSGDFNISNSYIEVNGTGSDHADGLQAYSPGSRGKIIVRNSAFKCGLDAATAGFFIADNWTGTIDFENVVLLGGPFGTRIHPDVGGDNIIRFKNVFYVPPFGWQPYLFSNAGGKRNVFELWENVCMATISNGQLVKGAQISRPS